MASNPLFPPFQPAGSAVYDSGLRSYLIGIYNYMALALMMTGITAFLAAHSAAFLNAMYIVSDGGIVGLRSLAWIVMIAPLGLVIYLSFSLRGMSLTAARVSYWAYAFLMGLSLASLFLSFTGESIARVFFIAAGAFGGMSLYGYTAKRNLAGIGSFLLMGLIGLILALLVNLLLRSSALQFVLSVMGVVIFTGLTAYDTQKLKQMYARFSIAGEERSKSVILGALTLYLDVINLFLSLLNLFGERK